MTRSVVMTCLMRACGVATSAIALVIWSTTAAWADPVAPDAPNAPAIITVRVPAPPTGGVTTVTLELSVPAPGQLTRLQVATDAGSAAPLPISAAVGPNSVAEVYVDAQQPF